jgi:hypothetical protein
VTHDITRFTKAKIFSEIGKQTPMFARFSVVAGERGAADAERDIRGTALKFYTEEGNWDLVGNNTPVFFHRDPVSSRVDSRRRPDQGIVLLGFGSTLPKSAQCVPRSWPSNSMLGLRQTTP